MKYVALRVNRGVLEGYSINRDKYEVSGQRDTDLNWETICVCDTEREGKERAAIEWCKTSGVPVYDPNGYCYPKYDISRLYRFGWRAEDREEMTHDFCLSDSEADTICAVLARLEKGLCV